LYRARSHRPSPGPASPSSSDVAVDVLHRAKTPANVEVICFASSQPAATGIYVNEKRRADLDMARSR